MHATGTEVPGHVGGGTRFGLNQGRTRPPVPAPGQALRWGRWVADRRCLRRQPPFRWTRGVLGSWSGLGVYLLAVDLDQVDVSKLGLQRRRCLPDLLAGSTNVRIGPHVVELEGNQHFLIGVDGLGVATYQGLGFLAGDNGVEVAVLPLLTGWNVDRPGQRRDGA